MAFGKKLKKLRQLNNMKQQDLADKLNITARTISRWELGINEPDIKYLKDISKVFNVSADFLIKDTEDINEEIITEKNGVVLDNMVEDFVLHYLITLDNKRLQAILSKIKTALDE